ncbi:MAG TPA: hypothetical protein VN739_10275 [Nitrososphaerales archaeon]|nr:hypothetical protein [Nitrososphaerales archaeon]
MKREIASILIVAALIIGAGIGYYGSTRSSKTTTITSTFTANNNTNTKTETVVSNYTLITTVPSETNSTTFSSATLESLKHLPVLLPVGTFRQRHYPSSLPQQQNRWYTMGWNVISEIVCLNLPRRS